MSVERESFTTLVCDVCAARQTWPTYLPRTTAEKIARLRYGWRKDKLGRNVCAAHPKLKGARR